MKTLIENGDVKLCYDPNAVKRFKVFKKVPMGISEELAFSQMLAQSSVFSKKLKSWFTKSQIQTVSAKVHALKYVAKKLGK